VAKHLNSAFAGPRPHAAVRHASALAALAVLGALVLGSVPAGAASTTTPTKAAPTTTPTTASAATPADRWLLKAIGAEAKIGSVRIDGKITQNHKVTYLDLTVNADGEGGGTFIQSGTSVQLERVGTLLYLKAPKAYWQKVAGTTSANTYGGKWLEISAFDERFISFDQFLDADDLVFAAFEGHPSPLTLGKSTTFQGHRVVMVKETVVTNGKSATGYMYIGSKGQPVVYKIVNNTPGEVSTIVFSHYGKAVSLTVPPNPLNLT
jgi:hypothetical protein